MGEGGMKMSDLTICEEDALIRQFLARVSSGLKNIGEQRKNDILTEIDSHLRERAAGLRRENELHPIERAISGLGDPARLASEFVAEARIKNGIHSYAPWTLLRRASHIARTSTKGLLIFLIGLIGYSLSIAGLVAALLKPFVPDMGLWIGSFGFVWGVKPDGAAGHELLGRYFIEASAAVAFVFGSSTTLVLRRLISKVPLFGKWPMA
jgi:uncharacterized membrane protein